jgi:putative transposase
MARPLRLEFPGAAYHVTARGDGREPIFLDDEDRQSFADRFGREVIQQSWRLYAFCLMGNHYHLLIETPEANLARGMRRLNGVYTQAFNRRHRRVAHVLQGRYKAIVVNRDAYLLELCRYVVLNPVHARLVEDPAEWPWSRCAAKRATHRSRKGWRLTRRWACSTPIGPRLAAPTFASWPKGSAGLRRGRTSRDRSFSAIRRSSNSRQRGQIPYL